MKRSDIGSLPWKKTLIPLLLFCALWATVAWSIPSEWLDQEHMNALLRKVGFLAPIAYIVLKTLVVVVVVIPSAPLDIASGAIFGPFLGTAYSLIGYETGAIACFLIARAVGRGTIMQLLEKDISFCDRCSKKHLALVILFARLEPVFSFGLVSYGAGLTPISLISFAVCTIVGLVPATILLNFYGKSFLVGNMTLEIVLGILFVIMVFLIPIWIKRKNPWGLYDKMMKRNP